MISIINNNFNKFSNNKLIIRSNDEVTECFLSYNEVKELSEEISDFLSKNVKEQFICIGLLMEHNIYIPSIVLSLQKLKHSFIFLKADPKHYQTVLQDLKINCILSIKFNLNNFILKDKLSLKFEDDVLFLLEDKNKFQIPSECYSENIFCIVSTSGTTGKNKYVKVLYECIYKNVESLSKQFEITQEDVIYYGTPLTFDPSLIELLLALQNGASLLFNSNKTNNPNKFHKIISSKNITILQMVPSVFMRCTQEQIQDILINSKLRILAFGGEPFPKEILNFNTRNNLRIFNLYGITEVSCWATIYEIKGNETEIPLGQELDETIIELRNEFGQIKEGEGEIFIGSYSRVCYINDEMPTTRPIFRATGDLGKITTDKQLFYLTRRNHIIKRFGQRIDLLTIEELISDLINLPNKTVWFEEQSKLLIFIKIKDLKDKINEIKILDKIRIKLLNSLPNSYFPDYLRVLREFPLTNHGKIDKRTLENIYLNQGKLNENLRPTELFKLLICKYFGFNYDQLTNLLDQKFFEIGGNSILAIQFLSEFQDELGIEYSSEFVRLLFENDIKSCLNYLSNQRSQQNNKRMKLEDDEQEINTVEAKKIKTDEIELKICWKYNFDACVDSPPLVFQNSRNETLVALGSFSHKFAVINAKNEKEITHFILPESIESMASLSACKKFLYIGCFDGNLYCLDYTNNLIAWTYTTADRIKSTPCLYKNKLIFGSYDKHLHCIEANTGKLIWKQLLSESIISNPLHIDKNDKIYIATIFGNCFCLSILNGEIIWTYKAGNPIFGSPCTDRSNSCIIWADVQGFIHCLSLDGELRWKYHAKGNVYTSLRNYNEYIIFGCHDHNLYILKVSGESSVELYHLIKLDFAITSTPFIIGDGNNTMIVVACNSGAIYLIHLVSGKVFGEIKLLGEIFSSPSVFKDKIYIGCRDNNLYCISYKANANQVSRIV